MLREKNMIPRITFLVLLVAVFVSYAALLWKPFWGLEYEDAYIYTVTARYMLGDYPWSDDIFKTKSILDGSLSQVNRFGTFGGHSEAFPLLIALFSRIFGYHANNALFLNGIFTILLITLFALRLKKFGLEIINIFLLCAISAPVLILYQSSGISEALSALLVGAFLILINQIYFESADRSPASLFLLLLSLALAIAVKRENLLLIGIFPLLWLVHSPIRPRRDIYYVGLSACILGICYAAFFNLFKIESSEALAIGKNTFSLSNLSVLLPAFILALLRPDYWGLIGIVFFGALFFQKKDIRSPRFWICFCMCLGYILMYSLHYRSRYQVLSKSISILEMMRYSVNLTPFILGALATTFWPIQFLRRAAVQLSCAILAVLIIVPLNLRTRWNFAMIEYENRIEPSVIALKFARASEPIICDVPMVTRMLGSASNVILDKFFSESARSSLQAAGAVSFIEIIPRAVYSSGIAKSDKQQYNSELLELTPEFAICRFTKM